MQVNLDKFRDEVRTLLSAAGLPSVEDRYRDLAEFDPYPEIPSSLLNSGHLASYAIVTGMMDPFEILAIEKPATYLVPIEGPVRYLDENGKFCSFLLSDKTVAGENDIRSEFVLKPNSICYVTLRPVFRMPAYLAGRFNLLIKDVYRGLLVGTGPLVDPGFVGRLSIPVHNFTSNAYTLRAGDGFVYFEFTKLSWSNPINAAVPSWVPAPVNNQPPFPASKNSRKTLDDYIRQATGGGPPSNAIHQEIKRLSSINKRAKARLRNITVGTVISAIVFLITTSSVIVAAIALYLGVQQFTQAAQKDLIEGRDKLSSELQSLKKEIETLKGEILKRETDGGLKSDPSKPLQPSSKPAKQR